MHFKGQRGPRCYSRVAEYMEAHGRKLTIAQMLKELHGVHEQWRKGRSKTAHIFDGQVENLERQIKDLWRLLPVNELRGYSLMRSLDHKVPIFNAYDSTQDILPDTDEVRRDLERILCGIDDIHSGSQLGIALEEGTELAAEYLERGRFVTVDLLLSEVRAGFEDRKSRTGEENAEQLRDFETRIRDLCRHINQVSAHASRDPHQIPLPQTPDVRRELQAIVQGMIRMNPEFPWMKRAWEKTKDMDWKKFL